MLAASLFGAFVVLAAFNAGTMLSLQIQHYGVYPHVGSESFSSYMRAQNRAALVPAIVPALLLLVVSFALVLVHPACMSESAAALVLALNLVQLASTFKWQRPLQRRMAAEGYDPALVRMLLTTNWVRTLAFLVQGVIALILVARLAIAAG